MIWQCHKATTEAEFKGLMAAWRLVNEPAADYACAIPHETWATYPALGANPFYLFGLTGQQGAEREMSRLKKSGVRHELPLHAVVNYVNLYASIIDERIKDCYIAEGAVRRDLTIFADQRLSQILARAHQYQIMRDLGGARYEVQHESAKVRTVWWRTRKCSCHRMDLICEHIIVVYRTIVPKCQQNTQHFLSTLGGSHPDFLLAEGVRKRLRSTRHQA